MKIVATLLLANVAWALSACSSGEPHRAVSNGGTGAGAFSGVTFSGGGPSTGGAASTGGDAASTGGRPTINVLTPVTFRGVVVDASTGTGFDATKYTLLPGVEVCVYGDSTLACATTTSTGDYEFDGAPEDEDFYFSYKKAGFDSVLYPVGAAGPGTYVAPFMALAPTSFTDAFTKAAGVKRDATQGTIHFAAVTPGTQTDSPFFQVFGGTGFVYLNGYQVNVSPDASHGPFYVSTAWAADGSLTASSSAGWGFVTAMPGDYTLTFAHPTFSCGTTTAKVVADYCTVYVGTVCSPPSDAGAGGPKRDAGSEGGPRVDRDGADAANDSGDADTSH